MDDKRKHKEAHPQVCEPSPPPDQTRKPGQKKKERRREGPQEIQFQVQRGRAN